MSLSPMSLKTELMSHQADAVNKVSPSRIGALFMAPGTGKSRSAIELVFRRWNKIDQVVWFCPVSLKETVRQEILKHTDCHPEAIYTFGDHTSEGNLPVAYWYIVGIESMGQSDRVTLAVNRLITERTMIILDESSYIKGHRAKRTLRITMLSERAKYRLILTGTPLSQGVVDLFSQMRFLHWKILGYLSFYSFAANHLEYSEKFPGMIVRAHNVGFLAAKIAPYVYQVGSDCLDLPPKLYETRYLRMTTEQRHYYELAKEEIFEEIEKSEDFNSIAIFRLFTILQQIVSGFWHRKVGRKKFEMLEFEHNRVDLLLDSIPLNEKVIIWAKYRYDVQHISAALKREFGLDSTALFYGDVPEAERTKEVARFRDDARFLVATQSCGGHGHTWNEAHHVVFYNDAFKWSEREQAEERCHRIGQEYRVTYTTLQCVDSIDDRIAKALATKGGLVSQFKNEVDKVKDKKGKLREMIKSL